MNLEMEFIKKEIQSLKETIQLLREEIENEKKYIGFKLIYKLTKNTSTYNIREIIHDMMDPTKYTISYNITSQEDITYRSALLPDLRIFHIHLSIYIELNTPLFIETLTSQLITQPSQIKPYKTIDQMTDDMMQEHIYPVTL